MFTRFSLPLHKKLWLQCSSTRYDANKALQSWKITRELKFQVYEEGCTFYQLAKLKAPINCIITIQLICNFILVYAKTKVFLRCGFHFSCAVGNPKANSVIFTQLLTYL